MENQAERKWRFPWKPGYIGVVEITQSFQISGIPVLIIKMTLVNIMGFKLGYPSLCRLFRFQGPELVGRWTVPLLLLLLLLLKQPIGVMFLYNPPA